MLKKIIVILAALGVLLFAGFQFMKYNTKKASPEITITKTINQTDFEIFYCSPRKNNREIFGALVPFDKVWRTGANEPTTFQISKDIQIEGKTLAAGKYSIWSIPNEQEWKVIFNEEVPGWGVSFSGNAARNSVKDALTLSVPVIYTNSVTEELTLSLDIDKFEISWDNIAIRMEISTQ